MRIIIVCGIAAAFAAPCYRSFPDEMQEKREVALSEWKRLPRDPQPKPWHRPHAICISSRFRDRILQRCLPRARCRRWRSLKEKRQAWGLA